MPSRATIGTGSSSVAIAKSYASLRSSTLPPGTAVNTVLRLTPAFAAMASTVVAANPSAANSSPAAFTTCQRVRRA